MTVVDLKKNIAHKIAQIEDVEFLTVIQTMITNKTSGEIYVLNEKEESRLASAREQLSAGHTIPHEKVKNEINQWLNSK
jgi:hypothetical protein